MSTVYSLLSGNFRLDEAMGLLERTPATLDALVRGMQGRSLPNLLDQNLILRRQSLDELPAMKFSEPHLLRCD